MQADEIEPRRRGDFAAPVHGIASLIEDRHVDPIEAGAESGSPDDIADVEEAPVRELGQPVANPGHAWHAFDARCHEIALLHPDERGGLCNRCRLTRWPIGVVLARTRWNAIRKRTGTSRTRASNPLVWNGTSPGLRPAITTLWPRRASSIAISAPELAAPTRRALPSPS